MMSNPFSKPILRFLVVVAFGIAFAYIESAVVVYLREIFHSDGFDFPLTSFGMDPRWTPLLVTEIGREAATLVLILTGCYLAGANIRQRFAYFLVIFAIWDIFYYVWLKVLIAWPASLMDWDILFLIPMVWASPVLYPVLVSITMLAMAILILGRDLTGRPIRTTWLDWIGYVVACVIIVAAFCMGGRAVTQPDYAEHFSPALFGAGNILAIGVFLKCLVRSRRRRSGDASLRSA